MTATAGTPTLQEVLRLIIDSALAGVHVAIPGIVKSYDAAAQTADVQPALRRMVPTGTEDEADVEEALPLIPAVRVQHPGGATWCMHIPLAAGDTGLLVFCDFDPAVFDRTGNESAPADLRRHALAHARFVPGFRTDPGAASGVSGTNVTFLHSNGFGFTLTPTRMEVGGSSNAAALASLTDDQLNDLKSAINGWTPVAQDGGAALKTALTTWLAATAATSSTMLKLGG